MAERRVLRDERGAIMLIALIFAIFAVGMLYATIGTAQSVLLRERMQDAADSSVLSGAVMSARSMNLLVLLNIIMAALLSVLVTLKLLEAVAIVGMFIAAALAYPTWGASLSAIPSLEMVRGKMHDIHEQLKSPIEEALDALHDVAGLVQEMVPGAAEGVIKAQIEAQGAPVTSGVAAVAATLPVEDDEYKVLCGEAGEFPYGLAESALEPIKPLSEVMGALKGPMKEMSETFSDWFCGDGGTNPPPYKRTEKVWLPRLPNAVACEESQGSSSCDDSDDSSSDQDWSQSVADADPKIEACTKSELEEDQAAPDRDKETNVGTGACRRGPNSDCSIDGPYETKAALARTECAPTSSPRPLQYQYQIRKGHVEYKWVKKLWKRGEPQYDTPQFVDSSQPPCGPSHVLPTVAQGYNTVVRKSNDVSEVIPVCSNEAPPPNPEPSRFQSEDEEIIEKVEFTEVTHIFACQKEVTKEIEVCGDQGEESDKRVSKRVLPDVALGDEAFQLRVLIQGDPSVPGVERIVRLALWGREEEKTSVSGLSGFGGFAVAQAEYFYDGTDGREAWMWNMNWRARLRRFKATDEQLQPLRDKCASPENRLTDGAVGTNECAPFLDQVSALGSLISH